ncbi:MAG: DUF1934 domain-containing protein [Ruminococcaceae bacterium]|nr:DUF1934 domain-containing protein [Oscillospiraceae bacterium]
MLKKVRVQIVTDRFEAKGSLYETPAGKLLPTPLQDMPAKEDIEHMEMTVEASYHDDGDRVCIRYKESELSGMEGSVTSVSFRKSEPALISMLRDGSVKTALVFEPAARHLCVYQTQIMPFEVCIYTRSVKNCIEENGTLEMDYTVELRGAQAEHTAFSMRVLPVFDKPISK